MPSKKEKLVCMVNLKENYIIFYSFDYVILFYTDSTQYNEMNSNNLLKYILDKFKITAKSLCNSLQYKFMEPTLDGGTYELGISLGNLKIYENEFIAFIILIN